VWLKGGWLGAQDPSELVAARLGVDVREARLGFVSHKGSMASIAARSPCGTVCVRKPQSGFGMGGLCSTVGPKGTADGKGLAGGEVCWWKSGPKVDADTTAP
jgi:hypothetical protein